MNRCHMHMRLCAQCPGTEPNGAKHQRLLVDSQKYQMMDNAVRGTSLHPLLVVENQRYTDAAVAADFCALVVSRTTKRNCRL